METASPEIKQAVDIDQKLTDWARGHTERYPDLILMDSSVVELTEQTKLAQLPETKHISGSPLDVETINTFVTAVEPRFPLMLDTLELHEQASGLLTAMGQNLKAGENIIVVANHDKISNLGFVLAAYVSALKDKGFEFRAGTIVGKIAPRLGREVGENIMSLTDVLALGCDDIYLGYPDTASTVAAGIPENIADKQNGGMLRALLKNLRKGGNLLVIDPTGTTNKPVDGLVTFGEVGNATERILGKPNNLVVPTGIWLEDGSSVFTTDGKLYRISSEKSEPDNPIQNISLNTLMGTLASLLNTAVDPNIARFEAPPKSDHRKLGTIATVPSLTT